VLKGERPGWREAVEEAMDRIRACLPANDTDAEAEAARLKHLEWMITSQRRFGVERTAPVPSLLVHVGNYWCGGILLILYSGPLRPSSMLKILGLMEPDHKISQRMLTLNLRELERDGLIEREIFASRRAHVEYCLTPLGRALSSIVASLIDLGTANVSQIVAAREAFDARADDPALLHQWPDNSGRPRRSPET
jgi:DNA-binding HxlR family transcriptional regulator